MNSFYDDVTDWLSVGGDLDLARDLTGQPFAESIAQLTKHGVTHVLDVRSEWSDFPVWKGAGLAPANYCHAPIVDRRGHFPSEDWYRTVEDFVLGFWLNSYEGDRLYVHCHMGINRAPSAAMLALLTVDSEMDPWQAFLMVRDARPVAGLVYAEAVGARHIAHNDEGYDGDPYAEIDEDSATYAALADFVGRMDTYWTPELRQSVHRGIAYYRGHEGETVLVDA